jgi:uncharacterized membrane protein YccF (DUF307 family)
MRLIGNIIWLIFGGLQAAVEYFFGSLILAITIIGLPFAAQTFKLGLLTLWPFGSEVVKNKNAIGVLTVIMNIIWVPIAGIWIFITHIFFGILLAITIIGLPFARQHFKLAWLALLPFGKTIIVKS